MTGRPFNDFRLRLSFKERKTLISTQRERQTDRQSEREREGER